MKGARPAREIFKEIDSDGTGGIDIHELRQKLRGQLAGHDVDKLFEALLADGAAGAQTIKYTTSLTNLTQGDAILAQLTRMG